MPLSAGMMSGGKGGPFLYSHAKGAKKTPGRLLHGPHGRGKVHYYSRMNGRMAVSARQMAYRQFVEDFCARNPITKGQGKKTQAEARDRFRAAAQAWRATHGKSVSAGRQIIK